MVVEKYNGPVWDGERFIFEESGYADIGYFHEFCHWCVAAKWQREMPDFALGRNVNGSLNAWGSSRFPLTPDESLATRCDGEPSWSDERRVSRTAGGHQELLSVLAMGLYDLVFPEADGLADVLGDFGFWFEPVDLETLAKTCRKVTPHLRKAGFRVTQNAAVDHLQWWLGQGDFLNDRS